VQHQGEAEDEDDERTEPYGQVLADVLEGGDEAEVLAGGDEIREADEMAPEEDSAR